MKYGLDLTRIAWRQWHEAMTACMDGWADGCMDGRLETNRRNLTRHERKGWS